MLEETIAFSKIPLKHQNKFEDRISFLYLDYAKIVQTDTGVVGLRKDNDNYIRLKIQLPVSGISVLQLGPGTSITNAAITSCARSGCLVMFTDSNGLVPYSTITSLTSSSKWALAQAAVVSNKDFCIKAAQKIYAKQFSGMTFQGTINQMRGLEGSLVRKIYRYEANKYKIRNFKRDTTSNDNVNTSLNIANSILYGVAASACQVLSISPSLGIIHSGNVNSFLFDLADLYKPKITIPMSFSMHNVDSDNLAKTVRNEMRREIIRHKILEEYISLIMELFFEYLPKNTNDTLIGEHDNVPGHINYGDDNV